VSAGGRATSLSIVIATTLACLVVGALFGSGGGVSGQLGIALLVLIAGSAGVLLHPTWVYRALAVVLGAVPVSVVPGSGTPLVLLLAVAVWFALVTHPIAETRTSWLEIAVAGLVITSLVSLIVTAQGFRDYAEFVKWLVATSLVFALLRLDRRELRVFGKIFVWSLWVGALFAIAVFFLDKAGNSMNYLSPLGYGRTGVIGTHLRGYTLDDVFVVRLSGTYSDPNAAGIFMLVGFAISVALLRGWPRLITSSVLCFALLISLSRSAIFSVVVAVILLLLFQRMSTGHRLAIFTASALLSTASMMVPAIYGRIVTSFGSQDKGSQDRVAAIDSYLDSMKGGWWFGLGWGRPEFTDETVGVKTNYVANSPLLSIYRGGIFVGIAFVLILVAGAVLAHQNARKSPWESGVIGAVFVGFAIVGLQLDFPVVTIPPTTMAWSVLIAFLSANPILPGEPAPPPRAEKPTAVGSPPDDPRSPHRRENPLGV
jgi:hypothetical protein